MREPVNRFSVARAKRAAGNLARELISAIIAILDRRVTRYRDYA
jgi:hypothetical protein